MVVLLNALAVRVARRPAPVAFHRTHTLGVLLRVRGAVLRHFIHTAHRRRAVVAPHVLAAHVGNRLSAAVRARVVVVRALRSALPVRVLARLHIVSRLVRAVASDVHASGIIGTRERLLVEAARTPGPIKAVVVQLRAVVAAHKQVVLALAKALAGRTHIVVGRVCVEVRVRAVHDRARLLVCRARAGHQTHSIFSHIRASSCC